MKVELRDSRQQRLVYCAKESFSSRGYYATSISEIVQQAGIARSTFYQYFDNKLHLFQTILDSFLQELQECIRPITLGPDAPPPLVQIQGNLTQVLDLVLKERALTQMLLQHTGTLDHTAGNRVNDFYSRVADMIERSLSLGITMKLVRPSNARLTAYSIIGAVKEVVLQISSSGERQPPVEELVRELLDFGTRGILTESQASLLGGVRWSNKPDFSSNRSAVPEYSLPRYRA